MLGACGEAEFFRSFAESRLLLQEVAHGKKIRVAFSLDKSINATQQLEYFRVHFENPQLTYEVVDPDLLKDVLLRCIKDYLPRAKPVLATVDNGTSIETCPYFVRAITLEQLV